MLSAILAQGNPGEALIDLVSLAGVVVVPVAIGSWITWFSKGRPKSGVVGLGLFVISAAFLIWAATFIAYCTMASPAEEIAVEQVESAYPILNTSTWSYSAKNPSPDVWIITVTGHTQAGKPIDKQFRVTIDAVEEKQAGTADGWVMLKQWPTLDAPTSQSTTPFVRDSQGNWVSLVAAVTGKYASPHTSPEFRPDNVSGRIPTIEIRGNFTFTMTSIPSSWMRNWLNQDNQEHSLSGTWLPGDDGDGSSVLKLHITSIDANPAQREFMARIGLVPKSIIYFDDKDGISIPNLDRTQTVSATTTVSH